MREFVVLGLGSNRSWDGKNSLELLKCACTALKGILENFSCSSVYSTKPMYVENQDDFFNMAACGFVEDIEPETLLETIHKIEASLGRNRAEEIRNGPRSIDIDIEIFGERKIQTDFLEVPHPRLRERAFVLVPMLEILSKSSDFKKYESFFSNLENLETEDVKKISSFGEL